MPQTGRWIQDPFCPNFCNIPAWRSQPTVSLAAACQNLSSGAGNLQPLGDFVGLSSRNNAGGQQDIKDVLQPFGVCIYIHIRVCKSTATDRLVVYGPGNSATKKRKQAGIRIPQWQKAFQRQSRGQALSKVETIPAGLPMTSMWLVSWKLPGHAALGSVRPEDPDAAVDTL